MQFTVCVIFTVQEVRPCDIKNGGCEHICVEELGKAKCYCFPGYFQIPYAPSKCLGKKLQVHIISL